MAHFKKDGTLDRRYKNNTSNYSYGDSGMSNLEMPKGGCGKILLLPFLPLILVFKVFKSFFGK